MRISGEDLLADMKSQHLAFVEAANPHSWFLTADTLHSQACALYERRGQSYLTQRDNQGVVGEWDGTARSFFLLGGFALENALKSFLVFENPHWISNGVLSKRLRTHSLSNLRAMSKLTPYKIRYAKMLSTFEAGLESWARYPCALSFTEAMTAQNLSDHLWADYRLLMRAYGNRLQRLLERGWTGPHGFYCRWEFSGQWFE